MQENLFNGLHNSKKVDSKTDLIRFILVLAYGIPWMIRRSMSLKKKDDSSKIA